MPAKKTADISASKSQRIDIWLWQARFLKTRTLATKTCRAGKVRINGRKITKANEAVTTGDMLTFPQGYVIRVVKVTGFDRRRGPAREAQLLYEDHTPPPEVIKKAEADKPARRDKGSGRPTKTQRRATDRLKNIFMD